MDLAQMMAMIERVHMAIVDGLVADFGEEDVDVAVLLAGTGKFITQVFHSSNRPKEEKERMLEDFLKTLKKAVQKG